MTTEAQANTATPAPPTAPPSASVETPGQGGESLLTPPADTKAAGNAVAAPPAGEKPAGEAGAKPEGTPKGEAGAEYQLKLPEGYKPDEALLGTFKELGLKPDAAQRLVEVQAKAEAAREAARQAEVTQARESTLKQWVDAARADKEVGGPQFDANLTYARSVIARFGTAELRSWLGTSGAGNHPELVRAFVKIGKAIAEDSVRGATPAGGEGSQEAVYKQLYPTMFKE